MPLIRQANGYSGSLIVVNSRLSGLKLIRSRLGKESKYRIRYINVHFIIGLACLLQAKPIFFSLKIWILRSKALNY
jgi:hypothetical protein